MFLINVSVVDLLKINLSNPDTCPKVKNRHFVLPTEQRLNKVLYQDKVISEMLEAS